MPTDQNYYASQLPFHRDVSVPTSASALTFAFSIDGRLAPQSLRIDSRIVLANPLADNAMLVLDNGRAFPLPQGVWTFDARAVTNFTITLPAPVTASAFSVDITEVSIP